MPSIRTNLIFIRRSRPKPRAGDVFRMHHSAGGWLFGRVILPDPPARCGPLPGALLVYYYTGLRDDPDPQPEWLSARSLLIPPEWTNTLAWRHGFYETIGNVPLAVGDVLDRHVFLDARWTPARYVDICGQQVDPVAADQASVFGLASYALIDDLIADALGVAAATSLPSIEPAPCASSQ